MAHSAPPHGRLANDESRSLTGRKILIVDDAHDLCRLYQKILESYGAVVTVTTDGASGIELAANESYDIVLVDLEMPKLSGIEAARQMRVRGFNGALIALSGYSDEGHISAAKEAGCTDYLCKDVATLELAQILLSYLSNVVTSTTVGPEVSSFLPSKVSATCK